MVKRISKRNKTKEKEKGTSQSPSHQQQQNEQQEKKGWDFGGIPTRDLKRNLGCG